MALLHANTELVTVAWLKTVSGIDATKVGTTVPQDQSSWSETGWVQPTTVGSSPNFYVAVRNPVVTLHCWAVNPKKQNPPWGKANDLAERIVAATYDPTQNKTGVIDVSPTAGVGPVYARVLEVWLVNEPHRVPSDQGDLAHYTLDIGMSWNEEPAP